MICIQCKKNKVDKLVVLKICNSCNSKNYRKAHPEKYNYVYGGMKGKVFKRDGYKCVLCGETERKNLLIHHKDGNGWSKDGEILTAEQQNNTFKNMLTLCRKCHTKIHDFRGTGGNKLKENQWSRKYDKCVKCKTTEYRHSSNGLCKSCYEKTRKKKKAEWYQRRGKILEKLRKVKWLLSE